jgi:predicted transcriptional regulator
LAGNHNGDSASRSVLLDPSDTPFPNNADAGISQEVLMARFAAFLQEEVHHLTSAVFDGAPVVDGGRAACGQLCADDGESSRAAAVTPEKKSK